MGKSRHRFSTSKNNYYDRASVFRCKNQMTIPGLIVEINSNAPVDPIAQLCTSNALSAEKLPRQCIDYIAPDVVSSNALAMQTPSALLTPSQIRSSCSQLATSALLLLQRFVLSVGTLAEIIEVGSAVLSSRIIIRELERVLPYIASVTCGIMFLAFL